MNSKALRIIAAMAFLANVYLLGLHTGLGDRANCANPFGIQAASNYLRELHLLLSVFLAAFLAGLALRSKLSKLVCALALAPVLFLYLRTVVQLIYSELSILDHLQLIAHPLDLLSLGAVLTLSVRLIFAILWNSSKPLDVQ